MTTQTTMTLAEQAFQVYDQNGEEAMLAFILENEQNPQDPDNMETGLYLLTDGTAVEHTGDRPPHYSTVHTGTPTTRPAKLSTEQQPGFLNRDTALLQRPNSGDVIREIINQAESTARETVGLIYDGNLLNLYDVVTLMPSLAMAIRESATAQNKGPFQRHSTVYLDQALKDWASDTLAVIPPHEFQRLIDRAQNVLEQKGHTG